MVGGFELVKMSNSSTLDPIVKGSCPRARQQPRRACSSRPRRLSCYLFVALACLVILPQLSHAHSVRPRDLAQKHSRLRVDIRDDVLSEKEHIVDSVSRRDGGIVTAPDARSFQMPQPLDSIVGTNFSDTSCQHFIEGMLNDQTFRSCHPVSLLLETSNAFFQISRSFADLTTTLDAACSVDFPTCSSTMAQYRNTLLSSCRNDYQQQNPLITQAFAGLMSYDPLYHATCMKTPATDKYCYASAVTNATSPTNSYVYYLPLGMNMTSGAMPSCNNCLQQTMNLFSGYASNASQPLSATYDGAAQQVNIICGPSFVVADVRISGAPLSRRTGSFKPITAAAILAGLTSVAATML